MQAMIPLFCNCIFALAFNRQSIVFDFNFDGVRAHSWKLNRKLISVSHLGNIYSRSPNGLGVRFLSQLVGKEMRKLLLRLSKITHWVPKNTFHQRTSLHLLMS